MAMTNRVLVGPLLAAALLSALPAAGAAADEALRHQLAELQARVAKLEAALGAKAQTGAGAAGMGMGGGKAMAGQGSMEAHHGQGGGMASGSGAAGMGMEGMGGGSPGMSGSMEGMEMMGRMPGAMEMPPQSALPGFPGVSHLYHVGATGFFLDHAQHAGLTPEQQAALGRIKEKTLAAQAATQRAIDTAEQELWTLTASDQPDATKIESKARELEKLRADERLAFIRAVGEAAQLLTDEQRKRLLGQSPPAMSGVPPAATPGGGEMGGTMPQTAPPSTGGMGHM